MEVVIGRIDISKEILELLRQKKAEFKSAGYPVDMKSIVNTILVKYLPGLTIDEYLKMIATAGKTNGDG